MVFCAIIERKFYCVLFIYVLSIISTVVTWLITPQSYATRSRFGLETFRNISNFGNNLGSSLLPLCSMVILGRGHGDTAGGGRGGGRLYMGGNGGLCPDFSRSCIRHVYSAGVRVLGAVTRVRRCRSRVRGGTRGCGPGVKQDERGNRVTLSARIAWLAKGESGWPAGVWPGERSVDGVGGGGGDVFFLFFFQNYFDY